MGTSMRIKAIFPEQRRDDVRGVPLDELKDLASRADEVCWFNGTDFLGRFSPKVVLSRLEAMPAGSEVTVMGGRNKAPRRRPVPTQCSLQGKTLSLQTHYLY